MIQLPFLKMINNMNNLYLRQSKLSLQLSTGQRINRAADDPVGLAISERMRSQIRGLQQAQRNAQDGISMIQTAEGGMNEVHSILQRMNELSVQAANGTYTDEDREKLNEEFQQLKEAIDQIASDTEFNSKTLMDGSNETNGIHLQVGPNSGNSIEVKIGDLSAGALDIDGLDISTQDGAKEAVEKIKGAVQTTSRERGRLGAMQNRLEHTISNLSNYEENLIAAESRIRDVDMAKAIVEFTKNQILIQATQAIMAQAMQMEKSRIKQLLDI